MRNAIAGMDTLQYDVFLTGKSIDLVAMDEDLIDRTNWYRWFNDPDTTAAMQQRYVPNTREAQRVYFREAIAGNRTKLQLGIVHRASAVLIGIISLDTIDWFHQTCAIAVVIGERTHRNLGNFVESHQLILAHAFNGLHMHRVGGGSLSEAVAQLYCRTLGFQHEGVRRSEVFKDGSYHDVHLFGLLDREYYAHQATNQAGVDPPHASGVDPLTR